jgi:hypothetical protein
MRLQRIYKAKVRSSASLLLRMRHFQLVLMALRMLLPAPAVKFCKTCSDVCYIWYKISSDLTAEFQEKDGTCNDAARASIRPGFHDADSWSQKLANEGFDFGGADGSLALFQDEINRPENSGLQDIIKTAQAYQKRYGIGMADLI